MGVFLMYLQVWWAGSSLWLVNIWCQSCQTRTDVRGWETYRSTMWWREISGIETWFGWKTDVWRYDCEHVFKGLGLWCLTSLSIISWRSVLLVEETRVPGENQWPATSHWQTLSHNVVSRTPHLNGIQTHKISGDRHWLHR